MSSASRFFVAACGLWHRYGFFGVKEGYFPLTSIAATVTCWGRQLITGETKRRIEEKGYKVIYGDTDSVMVVLTGMTMAEAWAEGTRLASFISDDVLGEFESLVIVAEKIARYFLLLKKKNYLAQISTNPAKPDDVVLDYKGIEMKRRDKTRFVKEMLAAIVDVIMPAGLGADARPEATAPAVSAVVAEWLGKLVNDELGLEYYEATKTAKIIYKGARPGHMLVMDRHNARVDSGDQRGVMWDAGKRVPYVVLAGKNRGQVVQWGQGDVSPRMEEPEWVQTWNAVAGRKKADTMIVDRVYYLALCETAVVRLLPNHLPSVDAMFAFARTRVVQQLTGSGSITKHLTGACAKMPTGLAASRKRTAAAKPKTANTGTIGQALARAAPRPLVRPAAQGHGQGHGQGQGQGQGQVQEPGPGQGQGQGQGQVQGQGHGQAAAASPQAAALAPKSGSPAASAKGGSPAASAKGGSPAASAKGGSTAAGAKGGSAAAGARPSAPKKKAKLAPAGSKLTAFFKPVV